MAWILKLYMERLAHLYCQHKKLNCREQENLITFPHVRIIVNHPKEDCMYKISLALIVTAVILMSAGQISADTKVQGKEVDYSANGVVMKGYLAYDENIKGKRPGVLVVHEWWGLNDYARRRARMLAELGYTALAVDMYGDGKQALHPDDAGKFSSDLMKNFDVAKSRFIAAMDFLKQQPEVDPGQIAAIGYCFGGGVVLNMARQGVDLKGVASFHGGLAAVKPAEPGMVKAKILVLHGAADKFSTPEQIKAFKEEMKKAGADFHFISYPGAMHSFTNPDADTYGKKFNLPLAYNAAADKKSWSELKKFLKEIFK
jgi:dienelactone hydrolase